MNNFTPDLHFARTLETQDTLAEFRDALFIDDPDLIYADGNSLGRLPLRTVERMQEMIQQEWGRDLIGGWNAGWYDAPRRVGDKIGQIIGAGPGQTIVSDSTSVNLFKTLMAALSLKSERTKIISDVFNFPSDLYIIQGCIRLAGNRPHFPECCPQFQNIPDGCNRGGICLFVGHHDFCARPGLCGC